MDSCYTEQVVQSFDAKQYLSDRSGEQSDDIFSADDIDGGEV